MTDPARERSLRIGNERLFGSTLLLVVAVTLRLIPLPILTPDWRVTLADVDGGSGLAFCAATRTLALVTDQGELCELSLEGVVLRRRFLAGSDFEDLAFTPDGQRLIIISERRHELVTVDWASLKVVSERALPLLSPEGHSNKRFEGLAVDPRDGSLWVAHERPGAIMTFDPTTESTTVRLINDSDVSAILASPDGRQLVVVSREQGLRLYGEDGHPIGDWLAIDAQRVEGIAFVPGVGLLMVQDFNPTMLLRFGSMPTWDAVVARLSGTGWPARRA